MPNHVINEIVFEKLGEDQIARLKELCCSADGGIDFTVLLPIPLNVWQFDCSSEHLKAFRAGSALDWCTINWGTKWNAYGARTFSTIDSKVRLEFKTAWAPPRGWVLAVFQSTKIGFVHSWLDEGEHIGHVETYVYPDEEIVISNPWVERRSTLAETRSLYLLLHGREMLEEYSE